MGVDGAGGRVLGAGRQRHVGARTDGDLGGDGQAARRAADAAADRAGRGRHEQRALVDLARQRHLR